MCGRSPDNHHAVAAAAAAAAALPAVSAEEMAHGRRLGKEDEEDDDREFEEEFLRFSMMEDEEDDDEEEIIAVSPPRRPPAIGDKGTSAVETVTNLEARKPPLPNPVAAETGGGGTKAKRRAGGGGDAKQPAAKKARSQHGFHGVHRRTYGRWAAEIRDTVIKGCRVWVGTYDTAEAAALAYDAAARRIYGRNARTNFPDDGDDLPPLPPPPAAKPCNSSKRPKTRRSRAARRGDHGAATTPPQPPVVADGIIDLLAAGDSPAPAGGAVEFISLGTAAALEVTDGWEFEPFLQELILLGGGVAPLDYYGNGQAEQVAAGGDLWTF